MFAGSSDVFVYIYFLNSFYKKRSIEFTYLKDNTFNGIKSYEFGMPKNLFYNETSNPNNKGFCENSCLGNGVS